MTSDEDYSKKVTRLLLLCILGSILGVVGILLADANGFEELKMIMVGVDGVIFAVLLILSYIFSKKKVLAGPILGIILGAWDILHLSVYGIIVGIYIIIHCVSMCKDISAFKKSKN
ncbi:MAG: hypothetical protein HFJ50_09550 [Clostridia bacterium]|jgi:membrane associated rhomboid family serine protease|nr:hypothetical protein [Clostridia bacterium]